MADDKETAEISRVLDAPRERVFRALIDPDDITTWYGPANVEVPRDRINVDARAGGRWELTLVRGGRELTGGYDIVELVEPEVLELRSDPMPEAGMPDPTTVRFELRDDGDKTQLALSDGPLDADSIDRAKDGWKEALDKLEARLASS